VVTPTIARLSRDAHFLLGLQKAGVPFVAADMPEANEMVVGIMAIVAQAERKMISDRTKAALAAAKRRGVRLGNLGGAKYLRKLANGAAVAAVRANAVSRADSLRPLVNEMRDAGIVIAAAIADELNHRGILTPRQARWHPTLDAAVDGATRNSRLRASNRPVATMPRVRMLDLGFLDLFELWLV